MRKVSKNQRGMTLLEMLISVSILSIVTIVIISAILFVYKSNRYALEQTIAISSARKGVENMVKDIREAAFSNNGDYPIIAMATSSITFYSDVDKDESIELVSYYIEDDILKKSIIEAVGFPPVYTQGSKIVSQVSMDIRNAAVDTDLFTYKDISGSVISDYTEIVRPRSVDVALVINIDPTRAPIDFTLRSSATLRNLINR